MTVIQIHPDGTYSWVDDDGFLHSEEDLPAVVYPPNIPLRNGNLVAAYWYQHGQLHRETGPAIVYFDGRKEYCLHDQLLDFIHSDEELRAYLNMKAFW